MQEFISNPSVFSLITAFFVCGIVFNGVSTYHETRGSSLTEKIAMYFIHILVSGLAIKGYLSFLYFVDLNKIFN